MVDIVEIVAHGSVWIWGSKFQSISSWRGGGAGLQAELAGHPRHNVQRLLIGVFYLHSTDTPKRGGNAVISIFFRSLFSWQIFIDASLWESHVFEDSITNHNYSSSVTRSFIAAHREASERHLPHLTGRELMRRLARLLPWNTVFVFSNRISIHSN